MKNRTKKKLSFDEWRDLYEDDIYIYFAEIGADRELGFDQCKEEEELYETYLKNPAKFAKNHL